MSVKKYSYALVVGRFQPFHKAHHELVKHALTLGDKVIIILGSARSSPDVKNPFTPQMREEMISSCFSWDDQQRLIFKGIRDYPYNETSWIAEIQNIVQTQVESFVLDNRSDELAATNDQDVEYDALLYKEIGAVKVALVGYFKDQSSYYLKYFPQWKFEEHFQNSRESRILHGTDIRHLYFNGSKEIEWSSLVPVPVKQKLIAFKQTMVFDVLKQEFDYIEQYKQDSKFVGMPFNPTFLTTDAVVTAMGHILVVQRGHQPGKGLLALPGGFLAGNLTLEDNMIKELKEETQIHVPDAILRGSIKNKHEFDYPFRSLRGRTVTTAYHLELQASLEKGLPLVKGGDDADRAFWMPVADLGVMEDKFFEDHAQIIRYFLGI